MKKQYIDENLWIIKNFLSDEELNIIYKHCTNEENWDPSGGVGHWTGNFFDISSVKELNNLFPSILEKIHKVFDTEDFQAQTNNSILRFKADPEKDLAMTPHHDMSTKYTTHGLVLYYNDNFEGGNIEYINKGISLKPEAGMLVCHPAGKGYTHQVATVLSGQRFLSTYFAYQTEFYKLTPEEHDLAYSSFDRETAPY